MNPRHRDRVAFLRICSGRLTKDMPVVNARLGTTVRLSRVYRFFGRDRETVPEAYPGDVVGLVNPGRLAIGDTLVRRPQTPVSADSAVSRRAIRLFTAGRRAAQAVRRSGPAARGRGPDAGVHPRNRPAASDYRSGGSAAVRCRRSAAAIGVRDPVRARASCLTSPAGGRCRNPPTLHP